MCFTFCGCKKAFGPVQAELYQDYKDLMYGPNAAPLAAENCDSDAEVLRPGSKVNTPAAYDSSSEDEALNQKIASRRNQLGIFERSRAVKAVFLETDSDSDVDKQPSKRQKAVHPEILVKFHLHQGLPDPRISFQEFVHQVLVHIHPIKLPNPNQKGTSKLQKLANPKSSKPRKPPVPTSSPFTEFSTPVKGGIKPKKKVRVALTVSQEIDSVCVTKSKRKPGRPRKSIKGGKRVRRMVDKQNLHLEERYNDPPLHLREAIPDTNPGNVSDEEDPMDTNLTFLDVEFNHGIESPWGLPLTGHTSY